MVEFNYFHHHERHQHKRIHFRTEVKTVGTGILKCSDISLGGMFLETVHSYAVGTILSLQFKLDETDEKPIITHARVQYEHKGFGVGLQFLNLTLEDRRRLEKFTAQT